MDTEEDKATLMGKHHTAKGFLRGINIHNFLDTTGEWHAAIQGWCEGFLPWPPLRHIMASWLKAEITDEHHYYASARVIGMISAVVFWILIGYWAYRLFS